MTSLEAIAVASLITLFFFVVLITIAQYHEADRRNTEAEGEWLRLPADPTSEGSTIFINHDQAMARIEAEFARQDDDDPIDIDWE